MCNHCSLPDSLAEQVAIDICKAKISSVLVDALNPVFIERFTKAIEDEEKQRAHDTFFDALFKAIEPYEKKFQAMITGIWAEQEKLIIANLKKLKKAHLRKDIFDDVAYPSGMYEKKVADESEKLIVEILESESGRVIDEYDFDIVFDMDDAEVKAWLKSYVPKFAQEIEKTSRDKLRKALLKGVEEGEGVPQLTKRIREIFEDWTKYRAERVARSEVIRASNAAAKHAYIQSGVVERVIWITHHDHRTCIFCEDMDGKTIEVKSNFFELGDSMTVVRDGKEQTMKFDYTEIGYPPLHSSCRCSVGAVFEEG